ncbi:NUDIX domain-containing protein [Herpetosiphon giganteus]|uniref:NUDIX domain-containing protein n=1 Tax=Herpetosiphon giganteus TaxID=2029754 RepID=UPI001959CD84|nr:NUDIX domain-containing protein [Herpetosiphon giganteus]MBM7845850.1 ADP-ribose pyrophosphatase YjhB (NUDIX family) [Herpetosiphon giganteus]
MAQYLYGDRIAAQGRLILGCSATLFDATRSKLLLTRRTDNGRWCLPGGAFDPGESVSEACVREVFEETGLIVEVVRLLGVYSNPHRMVRYADGNQYHVVSLNFEVALVGGELGLSNETTEVGYFSEAEIATMDIIDPHVERLATIWANEPGITIA